MSGGAVFLGSQHALLLQRFSRNPRSSFFGRQLAGMVDAEKSTGATAIAADGHNNGLDALLKPFQQRASEAEERLARLEVVLASKNGEHDASEKELSAIVKDFQSKLEITQSELVAEREKASKEIQKLTAENAKLQYRITHLIRALKEADAKLGA